MVNTRDQSMIGLAGRTAAPERSAVQSPSRAADSAFLYKTTTNIQLRTSTGEILNFRSNFYIARNIFRNLKKTGRELLAFFSLKLS